MPTPEERERRIAKAEADPLADIRQTLDRIEKALVGDPFDPKGVPGVLKRQDVQEEQLADHEKRIIHMEEGRETRMAEFNQHGQRIEKLEKAAEKGGDRLWSTLWDIAKLVGAATVGALIGKGGTH